MKVSRHDNIMYSTSSVDEKHFHVIWGKSRTKSDRFYRGIYWWKFSRIAIRSVHLEVHTGGCRDHCFSQSEAKSRLISHPIKTIVYRQRKTSSMIWHQVVTSVRHPLTDTTWCHDWIHPWKLLSLGRQVVCVVPKSAGLVSPDANCQTPHIPETLATR